jgi:hypothetical protein
MEKSLYLNAEVTPSLEDKGFDMFVMDMSVNNGSDTSYAGPTFDSLDDEVREQFDQLVSKNFRKFIPLISDYARAKEANLYSEWLQDVKSIVSP